jgi:hypothetical protein
MRRILLRVLIILTAVQLATGAGLYLRGFPYFGSSLVSNAALWEAPVALFHLPAIATLYLSGRCCGLRNGSILGPRIVGGHIRLSPAAAALLATTNWIVWLVLALIGTSLWLHRRSRRPPAPPSPPASG